MTPTTLDNAIRQYKANGGKFGFAFSYSETNVEFTEDFSKKILFQDGDDNAFVARLYNCEPNAILRTAELMADAEVLAAIPGIDSHTVRFILDEHAAGSSIKEIAAMTRDALFIRPAGGLSKKQIRFVINAYPPY